MLEKKKKPKMLHKRPKSARNLLKSEWNKPTTPKVDRAQQKKMIQEFQRRDQEEVERRLQVRMKLVRLLTIYFNRLNTRSRLLGFCFSSKRLIHRQHCKSYKGLNLLDI